MMDRRDVLKLGAAATVSAALAGCSRIAPNFGDGSDKVVALSKGDVSPELRLLNRLGFGPRQGDIARVAAMGSKAYVEELLAATSPEEARLQLMLGGLEIFSLTSEEMKDLKRELVVEQLQQADLLCAVYGRNPLQERMTDFWLNHFNIYALKSDSAWRLAGDTRKVIRKNALGSFPKMLRASAHSPAMLGYLDNTVNKSGVANENYARELMELHTLGVHGGYTQDDVMQVARCFTGWTVETRFLHRKDTFRFDPDVHDTGKKVVLGHTIPAGGGESDGDRVLEILSTHPSTARYLSAKLCRELLGREDAKWIEKMSQSYLSTRGNIRQMLRTLLMSDGVLASSPMPKRPLDFVASALRITGAETNCSEVVINHLTNMGQGPYMWPMPDGYPTKAEAWSGSMLGRWNFALALASGQISGGVSAERLGNPIESILCRRTVENDPVVSKIAGLPADKALAACLASPEFQWR
jgi:uncharacterized protein (DUF1800 family)